MKKQVFIIDTSAILSGKPIAIDNVLLVTTPGVSDELSPGGRDFQTFELLKETGLGIHAPTLEAIACAKKTAQQTGDDRRLSLADIEVVALAIDINKKPDQEATILSDDYSIQNVAATLDIKFQGFMQKGITKKFKWVSRCPGCGKQFKEIKKICPICGTSTKSSLLHKKNL
ncbi:MAG TPA: nucleic acid-binding protein [Thermoplasmata archaeon]|jgi:endoribonuclease Nob1|nr:MAG TPA: nucleic acid-binding protein [Thermoplasmata archaeon]